MGNRTCFFKDQTMVTNADRIESLKAQLAKIKSERDAYKARLDKHIDAARKRRENASKKKRIDSRNDKLTARRRSDSDTSSTTSSSSTMTPGMVWKSIKPYWTTNEPGDDARDEVENLRVESNKLIFLLRRVNLHALVREIQDIFDSYDEEYCDAEDNWSFYDATKKLLLIAKDDGKFK